MSRGRVQQSGKVGRRRNPKGSGEQLRHDLVAAAIRLIDDTGDASQVSLRAVAAAVGVAPTAVYLHFTDRDDLMVAVLEDRFHAFHEAIESAGDPTLAPREALEQRGLAYIRFALAQPGAYRMMFSHVGVSLERPDLFARYVAAANPSYESLVAMVQQCIDVGVMTGEAAVMANVIWSVVHGYSDLVNVGVPFMQPPEQLLRGLIGSLGASSAMPR